MNRCFNIYHTEQSLKNHQELCETHPLAKPILPKKGENILKLKNH